MVEQVGQVGGTRVVLERGDITRQNTDVIVNAANSSLLGGGGVDGAIHRAGGPSILEECRKIRDRQGQCRAGNAVITSGGNLKAKWVVHAVGPVWQNGNCNEAEILAGAYRSSLQRALEVKARSVSFPAISTGAYGYPVEKASLVALEAVKQFLMEHPEDFEEICFVLFDAASFEAYKSGAPEVLAA